MPASRWRERRRFAAPARGARRSGIASLAALIALLAAGDAGSALAADVFVRFKVTAPADADRLKVSVSGRRHAGEPWSFPSQQVRVERGQWSDWVDLSGWPWHGRGNRSGGMAEWPSMSLTIESAEPDTNKQGCSFQVQLSDRPSEATPPAIAFAESSGSKSICFLVPTPLRERAKEFETASQMTARQLAWAKEAVGDEAIRLDRLRVCTSVSGQNDPALARKNLQTLKLLGFNVINDSCGLPAAEVRDAGFLLYRQQWIYEVNPERATRLWKEFADSRLKENLKRDIGRWEFSEGVSHWVLADEIASHSRFYEGDPYDRAFGDYLREKRVPAGDLPAPIERIRYPHDAMQSISLARDGDSKARALLYHAGRFAQWFSAGSLRHSSDLIHRSLAGSQTEALPTSHGFWGNGMDHQRLNFFELGRRRAVDQLAAEDWLGLNHMYGPDTTYTGAQTFAYLTAVMRSATEGQDMMLRALITPSDDDYLRLKAYSAIGQGVKSFFFWAFGPTYTATENYWSDLRSMYHGIAKLNRALSQCEDVLAGSSPVRDPVAVLYSASHDLWHSEDPASRVEKRLLWHALRHAGIQPDFLDEEHVIAGRLKDYKVLYVTDWCIRRDASRAIDAWVRGGGVVYLCAGAAMRDEYYEPYVPPFAAAVWPADPTSALKNERRPYNERFDLPELAPITTVKVDGPGNVTLPALGCAIPVRVAAGARRLGTFADGHPAGVMTAHGRGRVFAWGFMPMLAYGQLAGFKPTTLEEKWPAAPRELIVAPIRAAKVQAVAVANHPVVETALLSGDGGSILVLANYTYEPIGALTVDLKTPGRFVRAVSTEGEAVELRRTPEGTQLTLPLKTADMILLYPQTPSAQRR